MSYGSGPRLSTEVGSGTATCPMATDLASWLRWAPTLPHVLWLRILPLGRGGLRRCQVSYGSRPHLPIEVGSSAATYPVAPYGTWASSIKKSLAVLPVQLGTHVSNTRAQVSKAPDTACNTCGQACAVNACKACRQAAIVRLQYNTSNMDHSPSIAIVPSDSTTLRHTTD
jgi:hypothetical protein